MGKSHFARCLIDRVGSQIIRCAAPTGIAAAELVNGRTLHDLLSLPTTASHNQNLAPLRADKAVQLSIRIEDMRLLLIDEISMVDCNLFSWIDQRLQQLLHCSEPFGSCGIVIIGDNLQLPPVAGTSLYKGALAGLTQGGLLFRQFKLHTFTQQMRAADDVLHTATINSFRTNAKPITSAFIQSLKCLTIADIIANPGWREAPIVVTGNSERLAILKEQTLRFAKSHGRLVFSWRQPLSARSSLIDDRRAGPV